MSAQYDKSSVSSLQSMISSKQKYIRHREELGYTIKNDDYLRNATIDLAELQDALDMKKSKSSKTPAESLQEDLMSKTSLLKRTE